MWRNYAPNENSKTNANTTAKYFRTIDASIFESDPNGWNLPMVEYVCQVSTNSWKVEAIEAIVDVPDEQYFAFIISQRRGFPPRYPFVAVSIRQWSITILKDTAEGGLCVESGGPKVDRHRRDGSVINGRCAAVFQQHTEKYHK